ncbi:MAG: glycosyltransferase family 1 protein [Betaproteobacteria bacterium]
MRIAIAYPFDDSAWLGGKNYFSSLFSAVRMTDAQDIELVLVTGRRTVTSLPEQFPFVEVVRTSLFDRRSPGWILRQLARLPAGLTTDPLLDRLLKRHRIDVFSHSSPVGKGSGIKSIGWLPDFQFLHFPEHWTAKQLADIRRVYGTACRNCDALIVSSHDALRDLDRFAPDSTVPRHVLHFRPVPFETRRLRPKAELLAQYGLPDVYFHIPNQFWAHKNHAVVVDALAEARQRGVDVTIACTGNPVDNRRPEHFESLMTRCREAGVEANFRVLGIVPYSDMQALMAHSRAVINPSRFEGWSTSVEEGKALGKWVLLSDIPVHREQAPDRAAFFSPDDPQALATLLQQCLAQQDEPLPPADLERRNAEAMRAFGNRYVELARAVA